jgi:hypothetical protein
MRQRLAGRLGGAAQTAKAALAFGGAYGFQSELRKAKAFEEVLVDLAVRGQKSRRWLGDLRKGIIASSNEFGVGKEQIADYVGTIIDQTGNTELAVKTMRDMTAVAFSANVPMRDLAGTVVEMQSKLALQPKEFITAMGVLASQADKGKVPLSKMASLLPEVLNSASAFGHTGMRAMRDYGATLQLAARGTGSLAEANTAMNRMLDQIIAKRSAIEKTLGIKLKKDNAWLGLADILKLISGRLAEVQKRGGKLEKRGRGGRRTKVDVEKWILDIFGIRGKKAMLPLVQQAMVGFRGRVGAKFGKGGLTSFEELLQTGGAATIKERVERKRKLSPELDAWNKATVQFQNSLHKHMLPALTKLGKVMPALGRTASWLIDNWKVLLMLWGGAKMASFISALVGAGRAVGYVGGGGAGGGGFGGVPGAGGGYAGGGYVGYNPGGRRGAGGGLGGPRGSVRDRYNRMVRSRQRRRAAAGGTLASLPLIPGAAMFGVGLAEKATGWSFQREGQEIASIKASRLLAKQRKELYGRGGRFRDLYVGQGEQAVQQFYGGQGQKVKEQMDKLLNFLALPGLAAGDFEVDPAKMAKLTTDDIDLLTSKLEAFRSVVSGVAGAGLGLPTGELAPPAATRRGLISEAAPVLDLLRKIERAILLKSVPAAAVFLDPNKTAKGVTDSRKGKKKK